ARFCQTVFLLRGKRVREAAEFERVFIVAFLKKTKTLSEDCAEQICVERNLLVFEELQALLFGGKRAQTLSDSFAVILLITAANHCRQKHQHSGAAHRCVEL